MIDIQEKLKDFSEQQLVREMQAPSGAAPQFLVLSEITRRKRMRDSMQPQDTGTTVAEEVVSAAGVPQGGIATMAQALAPNSSMAQNTGAAPMPMQPEPVQGMYGGGYVQKMSDGGFLPEYGIEYGKFSPEWAEEDDWLLKMLNPIENARQFSRDYEEGDYVGAGLNAAGIFPFTKAGGIAGKAALMAAPEVYQYFYPDEEERRPLRPNTMSGGGYVQKMAPGGIVVRNGRRYIEQEDGSLVDMVTGNRLMTAGQDISNLLSGIASLPERAGAALGQYSGDIAGGMNAEIMRQSRKNQGEQAFGMRAGPDTSYQYPPVPTVDVSAMDRVGMALEGRSGFPTAMPTREEEAIAARNELLSGLVNRFDQQAAREELMSAGGGRAGFPTVDLDLTVDAGGGQSAYEDIMQQVAAGTSPGVGLGGTNAIPQAARAEPAEVRATPAAPVEAGRGVDLQRGPGGRTITPIEGTNGFQQIWEFMTTPVDPTVSMVPEAFRTPPGRGDRDQQNVVTPMVSEAEETAPVTTTQPETDVPVTTTPSVETVVSGGDGGSGSGIAAAVGAAPMTSYERELADAMKRAERRAEQDKWLSLAQVGLNLMASKQPTLGGAIGEAGLGGLSAFQKARDTAEETKLGLSKALYDVQASREAAMAAQRAAVARATGAVSPSKRASEILSQLGDISEIDDFGGVVIRPGMEGAYASLVDEYNQIVSGSGGTFDATAQ